VKISFTGSHSVGKKTIINNLINYKPFKEYKIISNITRELLNEYQIDINEKTNQRSQLIIFNKYIEKFLLIENYISDRSILDVFAYTLYLNKKVNKRIIDYMYNFCDLYIDSLYDLLFYVPIEYKIINDGIRSTNIKYQREIDNIIVSLIRHYEDRLINIYDISGTAEERTNKVLSYVLKFEKNSGKCDEFNA
jgi:hypothetical protein